MLDSTPAELHAGAVPLLRTVGLTKRYGSFLANDAIDIDIWPQQIHALLGENGAGKSTLVKTIYGLIQPSEGEMHWQGEKMVLSGPSRRAPAASAWCSSISRCSTISRSRRMSRLGSTAGNPSRTCR